MFNVNVLVVGDSILDVFLYGSASRLSQEAPVPVVSISDVNERPGGAANVACNLKDLGCNVHIVSCVGNDRNGDILKELLQSNDIASDSIISHRDIPTTVKTRVVANDQNLVRFDKEITKITDHVSAKIYDLLRSLRGTKFDVVVISDYYKGLIDFNIMKIIGRQFDNSYIIVDPKPANRFLYQGCYCITPNKAEAQIMSEKDGVSNMATYLKKSIEVDTVLITMSEHGILFLDKDDEQHQFPAHVCRNIARERHHRIDVTGAGDAVISTFAAAVGSGIDSVSAAMLSNVAAGIVVNKLGTATCNLSELRSEICEDARFSSIMK